MSLINKFAVACRMVSVCIEPDGEGGSVQRQTVGRPRDSEFTAAIVKDSSFQARVAEKETGKASYTVTTSRPLSYHDVFVRVSDGVRFRVTGSTDDSSPPGCASFSFMQAKAEVYDG